MSLFNVSSIRRLLNLFSAGKHEKESKQAVISNNTLHCSPHNIEQRILLLSSEKKNRDELTNQLTTWGHHVTTCLTSDEAINWLTKPDNNTHPFHTFILDRRHLKIDPSAFATALKNDGLLGQQILILVGPQLPEQEQESLKEMGYHYQIATPLNTRALFVALKKPDISPANFNGIGNLLDKYQERHPKLTAKKILLAVNDSETRNQVTETLENEGHITCIVEDGHQALNALEIDIFDMAIIDAELPLLSGIQVINIHHLDCPIDQWMPFILLFEEDTLSNQQYYQYSRIKACMSKPIKTQALIQTLFELLKQHDNGQEKLPAKRAWNNQSSTPINTTQSLTMINHQTLRELELVGTNRDFVDQLIHLFEEEGRRSLHQLIDASQQKKILPFKEMAHHLLDSASLLGATQLYELALYASQIEPADFEKNATRLSDEITAVFDTTNYELQQYLTEKKKSLPYS